MSGADVFTEVKGSCQGRVRFIPLVRPKIINPGFWIDWKQRYLNRTLELEMVASSTGNFYVIPPNWLTSRFCTPDGQRSMTSVDEAWGASG